MINVDVNIKDWLTKEYVIKVFIRNPSYCGCDRSWVVGEYLDYENCKCIKSLIDKLVEECSENINENERINVNLNDYENKCGSCKIYIILFVIAFFIIIGISSALIHFHWYLKKSNKGVISINPGIETIIY